MSEGTAAHKVVIVGGGFGGLLAAQALNKTPTPVPAFTQKLWWWIAQNFF